jgi:hypothetical protein
LWDTLRIFHYWYPPQYKGREFIDVGVPRCRATVTVPQHPILGWQSLEIEVVGYRLVDTFEAAALKAITTFCEQHPEEVAAYPIGLFRQFSHMMLSGTTEQTIRYTNAQYHFQSLTQKSTNEMVNLAQDFHRDLTLKDDQIH